MKLYRVTPISKAVARPRYVAERHHAYKAGRKYKDAWIHELDTVDGLTNRELFVKALNNTGWLRHETLVAKVEGGNLIIAPQ